MNIRWTQRFQNFQKAQLNFQEMINLLRGDYNNKAYKMATIQGFEVSTELAWKLIKDYLNYLQFNVQSPRDAIKQAFSIELINDGIVWISMIEDRNLTSHIYDENRTNEIIKKIDELYFAKLVELENIFKHKLSEINE